MIPLEEIRRARERIGDDVLRTPLVPLGTDDRILLKLECLHPIGSFKLRGAYSAVRAALFLDLTFITLAMLVVGGSGSLLGAVVGALAVNGIYSFFSAAVNTVDVFGWHLHVPAGTAEIVLGVLMVVVLILRPSGITGSREFSLPRRRRPVADLEKARATT